MPDIRTDYDRFGIHAHRNEQGELTLHAPGKTLGTEAAADFAAWVADAFGGGEELSDEDARDVSEQGTEHINGTAGAVEVPKRRGPGRPRKTEA